MIWFIFIGDMLVMLFMVVLAAWVFYRGTDETIDRAARIPLEDESPQPGSARGYPSHANSPQPGSARGYPSHANSPQPGSARVDAAEEGSPDA